MQLDQLGAPSSQTYQIKNQGGDVTLGQQRRAGSHSAPLYAEKFDPAERIREMRTSVQKLSSHVLPTPDDAKGSITTGPVGISKNIWHSSPLDIENHKKFVEDHISARTSSKSLVVSAEDNTNKKHCLPLPPTVHHSDARGGGSDTQKIKRQAFSGPLVNKQPLALNSGPISSTEVSGLHSNAAGHHPHPDSPKISELHELPRPPDSFGSKFVHSVGNIGHSAPLGNRNRESSPTKRNPFVSSKEGSRLPLPKLTVSRSFSIPSSSQRDITLHSSKLLGSSQILHKTEKVPSPPLTPGKIRGKLNNTSD